MNSDDFANELLLELTDASTHGSGHEECGEWYRGVWICVWLHPLGFRCGYAVFKRSQPGYGVPHGDCSEVLMPLQRLSYSDVSLLPCGVAGWAIGFSATQNGYDRKLMSVATRRSVERMKGLQRKLQIELPMPVIGKGNAPSAEHILECCRLLVDRKLDRPVG